MHGNVNSSSPAKNSSLILNETQNIDINETGSTKCNNDPNTISSNSIASNFIQSTSISQIPNKDKNVHQQSSSSNIPQGAKSSRKATEQTNQSNKITQYFMKHN